MYLKPIVHSFASWFVSGTKVLKKYEVNKYPAIQILLSYNIQKIYTICNHHTSCCQLRRKDVERT